MVKIPIVGWLQGMSQSTDAHNGSIHRLDRSRLDEIRGLDFTSYSDTELRDAITKLASQDAGASGGDAFSQVFAIVNETISRRQGMWRFFDSTIENHRLQLLHTIADHLFQGDEYRNAIAGWSANGNGRRESFDRTITPILDAQRLETWQKVLVGTILYVRQRSQTEYKGSILLPACFYQTLRSHDTDNELTFVATDEQVLAGLLMYQGNIVEMNSGEGKTIAAAFPAVLHAVHGRNVHVITANDYLAGRDAEWLAPVFESLGLSVSAVLEVMEEPERQIAYGKSIVYGALREFGFDFMRDNLKLSSAEVVQRKLDVAIIDEADHALIDEANIPLIISGGAGEVPKTPAKLKATIEKLTGLQRSVVLGLEQESERVRSGSDAQFLVLAKLYLADPDSVVLQQVFSSNPRGLKRVLRVISEYRVDEEYDYLTADLSYWIDNDGKSLCLTEKGQDFVESCLGAIFEDPDVIDEGFSPYTDSDLSLAARRKGIEELNHRSARKQNRMHQIVRMIWGYALLKKNVDYLVRDDQVVLIDRYTGRGRPDTRYHFGLQAALEVKEGVPVQPEHEVLGQISVRGYISQYAVVSGMTGTALSAKSEFKRTYGLNVISVAPSNTVKRTDFTPKMYLGKQDKYEAILDEVRTCQNVGRPVLIGTHSINECDVISQMLTHSGIDHNLLNAGNDLEEDRIIHEAGLLGAVTVATDMAGRGTDILLEAGLDAKITASYITLLRHMLDDAVGIVTLNCPTDDAAEMLLTAIRASDLVNSIVAINQDHRQGHGTEVVLKAHDISTHGNAVTLDFGLGLLVIGTEASDNQRVDHQLMGRSGRQGAFGASQFFLSSEDTLLKASGPTSLTSANTRIDSAGRAFREGAPLIHELEQLQKNAAKDAESRRARIEEYTRVFEAQSFAYYRSRMNILAMENFQPFLDELVTTKAAQLSQKYFPELLIDDYARQFADLSEELYLDYNVSASRLYGVDLKLMAEGIGELLGERLDQTKERFTHHEFNKLSTLLYLQKSDELWKDHISYVQNLILSTQLSGAQGRGDMASFTLTSFESYEQFQTRIVDIFLPTLAEFPSPSTKGPQSREIKLSQDVMQILV